MLRLGAFSLLLVLMAGPRFCGVPQGASLLARCVTQMSEPPKPPGRVEEKYRLSPSFESDAPVSPDAELRMGPKLTGGDQGLNCGTLSSSSPVHADAGSSEASECLHGRHRRTVASHQRDAHTRVDWGGTALRSAPFHSA